MAEQNPDRRVRRTRKLLRSALLSLIEEKGYERTTVRDVLDRADVGRSTFYAHFRDKDDLLFSGLDELRADFQAAGKEGVAGSGGRGQSPTLAVFEHFARHAEVSKSMGRSGSEVFARYLHEFLSEQVRTQLRARAPEGETVVPLDALVEFATSTLIGLGVRWSTQNDATFTPRQLDRIYRQLTEPGLRAGLMPASRAAVPAAADES